MIAGDLRRLPRGELVRQLRRQRQERAETGNWRIFHLPPQPDHFNYIVRNVDAGSAYRVAWEPSLGVASCTCEDYKNTCRRFAILCKHIGAVNLRSESPDQGSAIPLMGEVVLKNGRYVVSLGPGNGRLIGYHSRQGCSCFMKSFCYRTGQRCFHSETLERWIEAGVAPGDTPLDAPVSRQRVAVLPAERPWDEWRVYEGALSRAWSVLPIGSSVYVVDNGGKDVPQQVVLNDSQGACSCSKFFRTGFCDHADIVRNAIRGGTVSRPKRSQNKASVPNRTGHGSEQGRGARRRR